MKLEETIGWERERVAGKKETGIRSGGRNSRREKKKLRLEEDRGFT